jgi:protein involved in polysaccharide export with SLBB domain
MLCAVQCGCVSTVSQPPAIGFAEPPRAELDASLAQHRIEASDVLQLKFADGTTTSITQTYYVAPDGTIEVAGQGKIQVAGKTLREAQQAVQQAVAVSAAAAELLDVALSEYYLVTVDQNGVKRLTRVPLKGEVRVKDALANVPKVSDKVIWITRPNPSRYLTEQILPVDWEAVARDESSPTNHLIKAGDWLFVAHEPAAGFARFYNAFTGMLRPAEMPAGKAAGT